MKLTNDILNEMKPNGWTWYACTKHVRQYLKVKILDDDIDN